MKKKLLSFIVAAVMVLSMLPMGAIAEGVHASAPDDRTVSNIKAPDAGIAETVLYGFESQESVDKWLLVDADGDGYNWEWIRDNADYAFDGSNYMTSASYSNQVGPLNPDNWIISPAMEILSADSAVSLYLGPQDLDWAAEHVGIYVGSGNDVSQYVSIDEFTLNSDDFSSDARYKLFTYSLADYQGTSVSFAVRHFNCSDEYRLNLDYVQFTGVVEGAPVEAAPTPTPVPTPVPPDDYVTGFYFETDPAEEGWQLVDSDGDGQNWYWLAYGINQDTANMAYEGKGNFTSASYNGQPLTPDNWAISPEVHVPEIDPRVSMYIGGQDPSWAAEHFAVYVGTGTDVSSYTMVSDELVSTGAYERYEFDLADFAGQTVSIAIRHFNVTDMFRINLDNVQLWGYYAEFIEDVGIGITEPAWNETPDSEPVIPENAGYEVLSANWFCDGEMMQEGDIFDQENVEYTAEVTLAVLDGYRFADNAAVSVNDDTTLVMNAQPAEANTILCVQIGPFTVERQTIEEVSINVTEPAWGEEPDYAALIPENANYEFNYLHWFCNGEMMEEGDLFNVEGAEYTVEIVLTANEGYKFGDDNSYPVYVNEDDALVLNAESVEYGAMLVIEAGPFTVERQHIDQVDISITEPAWGEAPDYAPVIPENGNYELMYINWFCNGEMMEEGDLFDFEGAQYTAEIFLSANEGYKFSDQIIVYVNDGIELVISAVPSENDSLLVVEAGPFTVEREHIEEASISVTEPAFGEAPDYADVAPGAPFEVEYVHWFFNGEMMEEGDLFDAEGTYTVEIGLYASEGFKFTGATLVFVNGSELHLISAEPAEGGSLLVVEAGVFTIEFEVIDRIEILDFVVPEFGANPNFTVSVPDGANYSVEAVQWNSGFLSEQDVFTEGPAYWAGFTVVPAPGYKFTENTLVTINGSEELYDPQFGNVAEGNIQTITFYVENPLVWGDANGDGEVTLEDALLVMRCLIECDTIEDANLECCDVNGDGEVDLVDALLIMRRAMEVIDHFPVE